MNLHFVNSSYYVTGFLGFIYNRIQYNIYRYICMHSSRAHHCGSLFKCCETTSFKWMMLDCEFTWISIITAISLHLRQPIYLRHNI